MASALARSLSRHPLAWFFGLAYLLTWSQWIPLAVAGRVVDVGPAPSHFPGLWGPCVAALLLTSATLGRPGVLDLLRRMARWRVSVRWYAVALSPLAYGALGLLALHATGQPTPDPQDFGRMGGMATLHPLALFLALIPLNGFAEDAGWRGFAQPRLQQDGDVLRASLLLSVPWALWHVPSFFVLASYRGMSPLLFPGFFVGLACGSIVLAWLLNRSGGSVLMVALYHASLNLASGTVAGRGTLAAIVSTGVMAHALILVALELRARRAGRAGPLRCRASAPGQDPPPSQAP